MDCIYDASLQKEVVPTAIGTAARLEYPYREHALWQWDITVGKMRSRD